MSDAAWAELNRQVREFSFGGEEAALRASTAAISAAEARGYARAREQAAILVDRENEHGCNPYASCTCDWKSRLKGLPSDIRTMKDEGGK